MEVVGPGAVVLLYTNMFSLTLVAAVGEVMGGRGHQQQRLRQHHRRLMRMEDLWMWFGCFHFQRTVDFIVLVIEAP